MYALLDQQQEDALHAGRLLSTEDRPFKRLHKKIMGPNSLVAAPNVPKNVNKAGELAEEDASSDDVDRTGSWKHEAAMDFAAFEANIIRTQFLLESNSRERERYTMEKQRILATARQVRANNEQLKLDLADAQATLGLRKTYDKLSESITQDSSLKSRDEQRANIQKLHEEIAELERESEEYARTWVERREQFGKIVDEGTNLLRLIRDEKEEAERKDGLDPDEEGEAVSSNAPTPRPTDGFTPIDGEGGEDGSTHKENTSKLATDPDTPALKTDEALTDTIDPGEDVDTMDTS